MEMEVLSLLMRIFWLLLHKIHCGDSQNHDSSFVVAGASDAPMQLCPQSHENMVFTSQNLCHGSILMMMALSKIGKRGEVSFSLIRYRFLEQFYR
jgi:hypothetical protein